MRRRDLVNGSGLPKKDPSVKVDPSVIESMSPTTEPSNSDGVVVGYDKMDDGSVGLVIDRAEMIRQAREKMLGQTASRLVKLANRSDKMFDSFAISETPNTESGEDPFDILCRKKGNMDRDVIKLREVKQAFQGFDLCATGLAPKNSEAAKKYKEAMQLLRDGKVVLPTVEEYMEQQRALEEEKKHPEVVASSDLQPMDNVNEERNVDTMANNDNRPGFDPSAVQKAQIIKPNVADVESKPTEVIPEKEKEPDKVIEAPKNVEKAKLINLAKMVAERQNHTPAPVKESEPVQAPAPEVVTFNVPENEADKFVANLPVADKEKVSQAKAIKLNRVEIKDIPVTTGTISSIDEYKKIVPRKIAGEYKELVLPNSGYIITVSPAGSLEMSTLLQRGVDDIDWGAAYKFCFDHMVTSSVGNMSFTTFVNTTSSLDIEGIIGAIYQISQTITKLELNCGNTKCKRSYPIEYESDRLFDYSELSERTIDQINKIIQYADNVDECKSLRDNAPVNQKIVIQIDDLYITIKHTDGAMIISQQPLVEEISKNYNQLVPLILTNVKSMIKTVDGVSYNIDNPVVIAEELNRLPDESLKEILSVEKSIGEEAYDPYQFALTGPIVCPYCGNTESKVPVDHISTLVFQRVQTLLEEVL